MKIISGGQTGVDRAALDVALELGLECGGWCPKGRKAEDGRIPARYPLTEMGAASYPARTKANIEAADATLIVVDEPGLEGGTRLTWECCVQDGKPRLIYLLSGTMTVDAVKDWVVEQHKVKVLNVAGPRESKAPGIYERARAFLLELFAELSK